MSGYIPLRDQKILCLRSGNRCAISDCRRILVANKTPHDRESIVGEMAHIKGEKPGSACYDSSMTDRDRNSYDNLIYLCDNHHHLVDDQPNTYTVERLFQIKKEHETWIEESTEQQMINVSFAELAVITKYLASGQATVEDSYALIPPKDKINKNNLSSQSEKLITMGMIQVKQVAKYLDSSLDVEFGERLKQRFVIEYDRLKNEEHLVGDDLFEGLRIFAADGRTDFRENAASLAVLVYLFENCDVFEK
jgi:hypothetical protein